MHWAPGYQLLRFMHHTQRAGVWVIQSLFESFVTHHPVKDTGSPSRMLMVSAFWSVVSSLSGWVFLPKAFYIDSWTMRRKQESSEFSPLNRMSSTPSPPKVCGSMLKRVQRDCKSLRWWTVLRKQKYLGLTGQKNIWTHILWQHALDRRLTFGSSQPIHI